MFFFSLSLSGDNQSSENSRHRDIRAITEAVA